MLLFRTILLYLNPKTHNPFETYSNNYVKNFIKHILLICFVIFAQTIQSNPDIRYGLFFKAYEVEKEERTSLHLTSEGPFSFTDGFIIEFDFSFRPSYYDFGYILRIIGENNEHIDILLSRTQQGQEQIFHPNITAIYKSGQILFDPTFNELGVDQSEWIKIRLVIDSKKKAFTLSINGIEFEKNDEYFEAFDVVDIAFGKNNNRSYQVSDIPAMSLRDVIIKNLKEKNIYHWQLSQHTQTGVYDQLKKRFAFCENPEWLMDYHSSWKEVETFTTESYPQISFNTQNNNVAIVDQHSYYEYNVLYDTIRKDTFINGFPPQSNVNQLLYNPLENKYFVYNFTEEVAVYDVESKKWNSDKIAPTAPVYCHNNRFFSTIDTTLYTFGGYGYHYYKNDINTYHFPTKTWHKVSYKSETRISPRYLGGLGTIDDKTLLIFGGYGNEGGKQELSPHNYYDLYTYDIETSTANKIWELDQAQHNFVVANSLVVDTLNNCFYALCFPHQKFNTNMQLYRFSLTKPEYEILADSIPFQFSDVFSYADLYLTNDRKQLVAVTSYTNEKAENATISIYTLAFPPLNRTDLFQEEATSNNYYTIWIICIVCILFAMSFIFIQRKRRSVLMKKAKEKTPDDKPGTKNAFLDITADVKFISEQPSSQAILLFGGFQAIDKESKVITGEFTPILKQLFLLILLYTLKDGKGISTVKLREILWFDKTNESAKNNRGVSLSKLRTIFEKIGDISISGKNSYWTVKFGTDIYCDYYAALILMDRLSVSPELSDIKKFVSIVSAGELLPNLQIDWVDPFKSNFSNKLIDLLLNIIANAKQLELSQSLMIDIADAIFVHDSLNEDALKIKCTLLVEMGKNGLAQKTYTSFIKEYQSLFATDFKYTFEQIIS